MPSENAEPSHGTGDTPDQNEDLFAMTSLPRATSVGSRSSPESKPSDEPPPKPTEPEQAGEKQDNNSDLFAMTALPRATSTGSCSSTESKLSRDCPPSGPTDPARARDGDSGKEEHDFFDDVGYYALVKDFSETDADPELSDEFAKLKESVERCKILQQSVKELNADLMQAQKQTKLSTIEDAEKQKESDEKIENIRKMEEDAKRMRDSVPKKNERIIQIEAKNNALNLHIYEE